VESGILGQVREPPTRGRTIASLIAAGATAGVVAVGVFIGLVEHGPEPQCASGIEGLGCALAALAGVALLALVLAAAANYAVLRCLGVDHAGPVGVLAVVALAAWAMALDQLVGGAELHALTLVVPLAALNLLLFAVLQRLPRERWATPAVAIGVIAATWPLMELGTEVESNRYEADQARKIATADFEIYEPLALDGYSPEELRFIGPFGDGTPYAEWSARSPEGPGLLRHQYTVRSFRVPRNFSPPSNCGSAQPFDFDEWPCAEVARTDRDEPVYVDRGATFSNVQTFYVRRGDTLITIETGVPDGLTAPQVVDLVNRLAPTSD
jgi:hypothetical protein